MIIVVSLGVAIIFIDVGQHRSRYRERYLFCAYHLLHSMFLV
jgi:hypothetical protein